jgi:hypothetical protein
LTPDVLKWRSCIGNLISAPLFFHAPVIHKIVICIMTHRSWGFFLKVHWFKGYGSSFIFYLYVQEIYCVSQKVWFYHYNYFCLVEGECYFCTRNRYIMTFRWKLKWHYRLCLALSFQLREDSFNSTSVSISRVSLYTSCIVLHHRPHSHLL